MEKPKCKICGERHWGPCVQTHGDKVVKELSRGLPEMAEKIAAKKFNEVKVEPPPNLKAGYRDYMREYMRQWRARKRQIQSPSS